MAHRGCRLLLLLLYLVGLNSFAAAQLTKCDPVISFFPKGGEDRNVPHAWGKTAQMAAGNYRDDTLYNIVLTSSNNLPGIVAEAVPILYIQPRHPLLNYGSTNLPPSCTGFVAQPATAETWVQKAPGAAAAATGAAGLPLQGATPVAAPDAAYDVAESAQIAGPQDVAAVKNSSSSVAESQQQQQRQEGVPKARAGRGGAAAPQALLQHNLSTSRTSTAPALAADKNSSSNSQAANNTTPLQGLADAHQHHHQQQQTSAAVHGRQLLQSSSRDSSIGIGQAAWEAADGQSWPAAGRHLLGGEVVTLPAQYRLQYSLNGSNPMDTGDISMLTPVQKIVLGGLRGYPDGYYCLTIKLTIIQGTGRMAGHIPVPPYDLHTTSQVCFYKLDGLPTGHVSYSTCNETLSVAFKDLGPHPIPLHPGSRKSLFFSVFHHYANLNRTEDWSWPPETTPKSLSHWRVLNAASPSRTFYWLPEDKVADGWYNLRMEASITTDFPSLMALNSIRAGKYDALGAPPELSEKPKYLATPLYKNGTVAGIQSLPTEFKQLTGPEEELRLAVGDEMQLSWAFDGFGDMFCYIDGRLFNNMGDFNCRSPVQVQIPDRRNHTFRVALQDVCNQTFIVDAVYGFWGYKLLRAPPPRVRIEDSANAYVSNGEKFEIGNPASATLRAPKAQNAKASHNAANYAAPWPSALLTVLSLVGAGVVVMV